MNITKRDTLAIARIAARRGRAADLARAVREQFDLDLPEGPRRVESTGLALIGIGVGTWLATRGHEPDTFATSLREAFNSSATVSDQIGAYEILGLTGQHVPAVLAKFIALDLHPRAFPVGSAAATLAGHIPLTFWRLADSFELAVPRSYSLDFQHLLAASAAEFQWPH
ncbi:MAG: sarcosine oxidase, gamma subunit [Proteobacteria bacterium]|nr:sarcosine oxidase, gamma subunit [Pseudomonadota bacterium]